MFLHIAESPKQAIFYTQLKQTAGLIYVPPPNKQFTAHLHKNYVPQDKYLINIFDFTSCNSEGRI